MKFPGLRVAVTAAAMLFASLIQPSAAWAQASPSTPVVLATLPAANAAVNAPAMSGSAWIAQGTVVAPPAAQAAAPASQAAVGPILASSLTELIGDMPIPADSAELSADMKCLAQAVYFEARGEPIEGQLAVAEVVINRAKSDLYPDNFCDVITQPAQFSFVHHGRIPLANEASAAWQRAIAIAEIAQRNLWQSKAADALYFHATYVNPAWAHQKVELAQIDTHIFYR